MSHEDTPTTCGISRLDCIRGSYGKPGSVIGSVGVIYNKEQATDYPGLTEGKSWGGVMKQSDFLEHVF